MGLMNSVDYAILAIAFLLPSIYGLSILFGLIFSKKPEHF